MEQLPEEVLLLVLELLDERTLRRAVPLVCRRWARLSRSRSVWRNVLLAFQDGGDFVERMGWTPPAALGVELHGAASKSWLDDDQWRVVQECASRGQARRLGGLPLVRGVEGSRRLAAVLAACSHCAEHVSLLLEPPLDQPATAQVWALLASMPRLSALRLGAAADHLLPNTWLQDPESVAHELCWRWDEGWPRLEHLDLRGLPGEAALWLLAGFLRVRRAQLHTLLLGPGSGAEPSPRLLRALRGCPALRHLGVSCSKDLWRVDCLKQVMSLTLCGLPRRDTAEWVLQSPLAARIESLSMDGVNPSLFDVLPSVGKACHRLHTLSFRRCQVPVRFAHHLDGCPIRTVTADNMRAEHVLEARRLPHLARLHLTGHLGNFNSMMAAVAALRSAKPHLQVAGIEDGLFNNWGRGVHRALPLQLQVPVLAQARALDWAAMG